MGRSDRNPYIPVHPDFKKMLKAKAGMQGKTMKDLTEEMAQKLKNDVRELASQTQEPEKKRGLRFT